MDFKEVYNMFAQFLIDNGMLYYEPNYELQLKYSDCDKSFEEIFFIDLRDVLEELIMLKKTLNDQYIRLNDIVNDLD